MKTNSEEEGESTTRNCVGLIYIVFITAFPHALNILQVKIN